MTSKKDHIMNGLRTTKRYHITSEFVTNAETNKRHNNKLDYICYYNEDGSLTSISKHLRKDSILTIKNIKPNQHGFKSALKACFNSKPCTKCIG